MTWWHPAGSIMQGAGVGRKISMANCTTISLGLLKDDEEWDSLESIVKNTAYTVAKTAAYRQGLGVDFSRLRPRDTKVLNSSNISSGAIHWMKFIDSIGYYVGQKGRIPAMLFSISCSHPDVIEFIKAKADYTVVQNANISVQCTNAFYDAVNANADWDLTFEIPEVKKGQKFILIIIQPILVQSMIQSKIDTIILLAKIDRMKKWSKQLRQKKF
jgi:ribonucleoside-diphosphate reductase alpha chain